MPHDVLSILSDAEREKLRETTQPEWIRPMLATPIGHRFSDADWVYERKFHGVREDKS